MDDREKIEERLRKKEQEILALEDRLRVARVYVQALHDVLKLLEGAVSSPPLSPIAPGNTEKVLRSGSAVAQARQVILKRGQPVHISALLEELGKDSSRESRASLASSLAAYVRRGEIFTRPAPNTFGLVELGHKPVREDEDDQPPPGFGSIRRDLESPPPPPPAPDEEMPF